MIAMLMAIIAAATAQDLPRVLLIGDSISMAYTPYVQDTLCGTHRVFRPWDYSRTGPINSANSRYALAHIEQWLGDSRWKVIHFNFGLHDIAKTDPTTGGHSNDATAPNRVPPDEYRENLEAIVSILAATGARLVFGLTTPINGVTLNPMRLPSDVVLYNDIAIDVMTAHGIEINDLYSPAVGRLDDIQHSDGIHFNPKGSAEQGKQVSAVIVEGAL